MQRIVFVEMQRRVFVEILCHHPNVGINKKKNTARGRRGIVTVLKVIFLHLVTYRYVLANKMGGEVPKSGHGTIAWVIG